MLPCMAQDAHKQARTPALTGGFAALVAEEASAGEAAVAGARIEKGSVAGAGPCSHGGTTAAAAATGATASARHAVAPTARNRHEPQPVRIRKPQLTWKPRSLNRQSSAPRPTACPHRCSNRHPRPRRRCRCSWSPAARGCEGASWNPQWQRIGRGWSWHRRRRRHQR
jgi:hypothetical protein